MVDVADDIATVIMARHPEQAQQRVAHVASVINDYLVDHGLALAASKTEVVVLTKQRCFPEPLRMHIGGEVVEASKAVKHLGEMVDAKLTHWVQIRQAAIILPSVIQIERPLASPDISDGYFTL